MNTGRCFIFVIVIALMSSQAMAYTAKFAEANFACSGLNPQLDQAPVINIDDGALGEIRIKGADSKRFSLQDQEILFHAIDGETIVLGTLSSAPTCQVYDFREPAASNWNSILLNPKVQLDVGPASQNQISITDLSTQKTYTLSW